MAINFSSKRLQIDRAKAVVVGSVAAAAFLVVFSLIISRALLSQRNYQNKVIKEQKKAVDQLKKNVEATNQLVDSYKRFVEEPINVLGGNPAGTGDKDGDNARVILDALPSKYDFPALASSLEKLLTTRNFKLEGITGTDDEVAQGNVTQSSTPTPIEIPFEFAVNGDYKSIQELVDTLQNSIRPINAQTITLSGKNSAMTLEVSAVTYYLPEKQLVFPTKEVK